MLLPWQEHVIIFAINLDIEKYRKYLAPLNLDKDREGEIIRHIYMIMDEFVPATFNKYPIQLVS